MILVHAHDDATGYWKISSETILRTTWIHCLSISPVKVKVER